MYYFCIHIISGLTSFYFFFAGFFFFTKVILGINRHLIIVYLWILLHEQYLHSFQKHITNNYNNLNIILNSTN